MPQIAPERIPPRRRPPWTISTEAVSGPHNVAHSRRRRSTFPSTMRGRGAGVLLLGLSVLVLGAGSGSGSARGPAPRLRVLDRSLASVQSHRAVRIGAVAGRTGRFRLFATVLAPAGGGAPAVVTRVVVVRLRAGRARAVSLPLLAAGRRALAG